MNKTASLTPDVKRIINDKATEYPHSGAYNQLVEQGTYLCRQCGLALFRASAQFSAGCGWPSFDDSLMNRINESPDCDGQRIEITCQRCKGHLGHVFRGEHFTLKNCRYCVNSASMDFVLDNQVEDTEEAIVAGGCFWSVDFLFHQLPGVLKTEVGYTGGNLDNPTYEEVCQGRTGHYEATRVIFDNKKTDYLTVIKRFFEIHDPTQINGQGPDIGSQYQSAIFYYTDDQAVQAHKAITLLEKKGYKIATKLRPVEIFWPAEGYHQDYYRKNKKIPYCHRLQSRF